MLMLRLECEKQKIRIDFKDFGIKLRLLPLSHSSGSNLPELFPLFFQPIIDSSQLWIGSIAAKTEKKNRTQINESDLIELNI